MKTAIQTAIENIDQCLNSDDVKAMLGELLEMEKEQMKLSYNDGKLDAYRQDDVPTAEEYVYQKYGL